MLKDSTYILPLTLAVAVHAGVLLPGSWSRQVTMQVQMDPGQSAVQLHLLPSVASSPSRVTPATEPTPPREAPVEQPSRVEAPRVSLPESQPPHTPSQTPSTSAAAAPWPSQAEVVGTWRQAVADARGALAPLAHQARQTWQSTSALREASQPVEPPASQGGPREAAATPPASAQPEPSATPAPMDAPAAVTQDGDLRDAGVFCPDAVTNQVTPVYPAVSRRRGEQGVVLVKVMIGSDGRPTRIQVQRSSGHRRLDDAAVAAAGQSTYRPVQRHGRAVVTQTVLAFQFRLTDDR